MEKRKAILLIMDGLGDLPTPKTALEMAKTPNMDKMAKEGICGMMAPLWRGIPPGSDTSHLNLFGYPPEQFYPGRGPLEALGSGLKLKKGDVAFRANFATIKKGVIVDRRAGRIDTETASQLSKNLNLKIDGVECIFTNTVEHRGVLILRGKGINANLTGTDPHKTGIKLQQPKGFDKKGSKAARVLWKWTREVMKRLEKHPINKTRGLPVNGIIVRGAGEYKEVPSIKERFGLRAACVAGGALYKGVAKYVGMDILKVKGATGDKNTNLKNKGKAAIEKIKDYDFIFLHVKATDSFSHDGDIRGKAKFIEKIDKELIPYLKKSGAIIIITGDHTTASCRKKHTGYEVPIIIYNPYDGRNDDVRGFDEKKCMKGGLGHIMGCELMQIILNEMDLAKMSGT